MISIIKPTDKVSQVFTSCISTVKDSALKQKYIDSITTLNDAESDFELKFHAHEIYKIQQTNNINGNIARDEMIKVYTYRMLDKGQPGRKYYDKIIASAPDDLCPYCSIREADTIDHYLPKTKFPVFSVTPINLIPSCTLCNKDKKIEYPKSNIDQPLHPYYDKINDVNWIKAKILQSNPVAVIYYALPPNYWSSILKRRVINHFNSFSLAQLYSSYGNRLLRGNRNRLKDLYDISQIELKKHLLSSYKSNKVLGINSYEAVLYDALYNDNWFCSIGAGY